MGVGEPRDDAAQPVVLGISEAAEQRGGPAGAGDHVSQGDRGQMLVTLLAAHHFMLMVSLSGAGNTVEAPGTWVITGQTGLAVLTCCYDQPHQVHKFRNLQNQNLISQKLRNFL